jgi:hypothetical protein
LNGCCAATLVGQCALASKHSKKPLGRVYHQDPGLNHEFMEEFQKLGYPVFSQSTLQIDEDLLDRLFGDEAPPDSLLILLTFSAAIADIIKRHQLEGNIEAQLDAFERSLRSQQTESQEMAVAGD